MSNSTPEKIRPAWWAALLLLAACNQGQPINSPPVAGEVIFVPAFEWHIVDRTTLRSIYANSGKPINPGDTLHGFAGIGPDGRNIIFTLPPRYVDDQVTMTLGHEAMHIALGPYHPE